MDPKNNRDQRKINKLVFDMPEPIGPKSYSASLRKFVVIIGAIVAIVITLSNQFKAMQKEIAREKNVSNTPTSSLQPGAVPEQTAQTPSAEYTPSTIKPEPTPPPGLLKCPSNERSLTIIVLSDGLIMAGNEGPLITIKRDNGKLNFDMLDQFLIEMKSTQKNLNCASMVWGFPPDGTPEFVTLKKIIQKTVGKVGFIDIGEFRRMISIPMK